MGVGKTVDGRYYCQYREIGWKSAKKKYFGRGVEAKKEATNYDLYVKYQKNNNEEIREKDLYLRELINIYLKHEKVHGRDEKFRIGICNLANDSWLEKLPEVPIAQLKASDFDQLADSYKNLSPSTFNRYLTYLKGIFSFGVNFEHIEKNPMKTWYRKVRKTEKRRDLIINEEDVKAMIAVAPIHLARAIRVAINTGVRPGPSELFKLKFSDIDFDNMTIRVSGTKTKKSDRIIPLRKDFLDELLLWQKETVSGFIVEFRGKPIKSFKKSFKRVAMEVGLPDEVVPYHLRHFFASATLGNKADIKAVADIMGHSSPDMLFKHYYHQINDNHIKAVNLLPNI